MWFQILCISCWCSDMNALWMTDCRVEVQGAGFVLESHCQGEETVQEDQCFCITDQNLSPRWKRWWPGWEGSAKMFPAPPGPGRGGSWCVCVCVCVTGWPCDLLQTALSIHCGGGNQTLIMSWGCNPWWPCGTRPWFPGASGRIYSQNTFLTWAFLMVEVMDKVL
jgi:hypothetical protein